MGSIIRRSVGKQDRFARLDITPKARQPQSEANKPAQAKTVPQIDMELRAQGVEPPFLRRIAAEFEAKGYQRETALRAARLMAKGTTREQAIYVALRQEQPSAPKPWDKAGKRARS